MEPTNIDIFLDEFLKNDSELIEALSSSSSDDNIVATLSYFSSDSGTGEHNSPNNTSSDQISNNLQKKDTATNKPNTSSNVQK